MDGADQATILVLRPCSQTTDCDQEANEDSSAKDV